ncbi:hypothetical protein [Lysobacter gummosus]
MSACWHYNCRRSVLRRAGTASSPYTNSVDAVVCRQGRGHPDHHA